jgi:Cu+-exporting ATPase
MRTTLTALSLTVLAACACATAPALPPPAAAPAATIAAPRAPGEAAIGDRTTCPVSGEEFIVSATSPRTEYGGKTYFFCCVECAKKFQAEPARYLKPGG